MSTYTYLPEVKKTFHCSVPMEGIQQLFLIDGKLQEVPPMGPALQVTPGAQGLGISFEVNDCYGDAPVQLISVRKELQERPLSFVNSWKVAPGAQARIVVCDHTLEPLMFQTSRTAQITVGDHGCLDILFMQNEHKDSFHQLNIEAQLGEGARLDCHVISLYGGTIENRIHVTLNHTGAQCRLNGLYLMDQQQRVDWNVTVDHRVGGCYSSQLFKGILDNSARAAFNGLIKVDPQAQKTQAYQANHNLLLTKEARVVTKPQLEIYADDVKCSHGATVGRMNELELFYMRSRGIALREAQTLQQMAFVKDVLDHVKTTAIRERLESMVESRLRGEFSRCSHCTMHCC